MTNSDLTGSGAGPEADHKTHVDRRLAIGSILGFWAFYYVINTTRAAIIGAEDQLIMAERRAAVTVASILLTLLLWRVMRRFEHRTLWTMVGVAVLASIPVSMTYAGFNHIAFYVYEPTQAVIKELAEYRAKTPSELHIRLMMISYQAAEWYYFIVTWTMFYIAMSYAAKVGQAERAAATYRAEAQTAELRALRYQINPHFLFNTLNSLSTLVLRGRADEADKMIVNLSTFFRTSLTTDADTDVPLADEIRMQQLYLDIERVRFPERLVTVIDLPPDVAQVRVPSLILQPLVENAVKYGVASSSAKVTVAIKAAADGGNVKIVVEDDATSDPAKKPPGTGAGVGIENVRARLKARFNGRASCHFGPRPEGGFRVELTVPRFSDP